MLEIIKGDNGEIKACLEWYLVNEKGEFDSNGEFVWVNEMEISPQYRNNGILKTFTKIIIEKCNARVGYFWRQYKYPGRPPHLYTREQWLRRIK